MLLSWLLLVSILLAESPVFCATTQLHRRSINVTVPTPDTATQSDFGTYVVDRKTGIAVFEEAPLIVRLGMLLLFNTYLITNPFIRLQLSLQTRRMGQDYDSPASVSRIPTFIETYNLSLTELQQPDISKYANFNEFFARKLKDDARPIAAPNDTSVITSMADSRLVVYESVSDATTFWIKSQTFSLASLMNNDPSVEEFTGGSLAIFRLAPQDYHRFHAPVEGTIERWTDVQGDYLTVNPLAVKENLPVLTQNRRAVMILNSPHYGRVAVVMVGALLVGSIISTVTVGSTVKKGQELGYFAYGGSTVVVVFREQCVKWSKDLLEWSQKVLEVHVLMGEQVGVSANSTASA